MLTFPQLHFPTLVANIAADSSHFLARHYSKAAGQKSSIGEKSRLRRSCNRSNRVQKPITMIIPVSKPLVVAMHSRARGRMIFLRRHAGLILAFCLIAPTYLVWTWTDQLGAIDSDGPSYLLMAQHYSSHVIDHSVTSIAATFGRFPPLYPLLLAHLHVAHDLPLAHAATTIFFLLGLVAFYRWLLGEGLAWDQASLLVLLFAAIPGSWLPGLTFQSEYLYLGCSLLALIAMSSFKKQQNNQALYLAALAVAGAVLTRTIGLTLFVPLLAVALCAPRGTAALALAIALAPLILWAAAHPREHAYFGSLLATYDAHPLQQLRDQLILEGRALRFGFEQNFEQVPASRLVLDLLGVLGLAGATARAWNLKPDGVYVAAYLCLLLLWPYPEEAKRLIWPIIPILLGQMILLAASWSGESTGSKPARYATITAGGVILLGSLPAIALASGRALSAGDFGRPEVRGMLYWYDADAARAKRWVETETLITEALSRIDREIPRQDCVLSVRPELINYFSHRLSTYPPAGSLSDPEFAKQLKAPGCRYVFMVGRTYGGFPDSMYPLQRIAQQARIIDHSELSTNREGNGYPVAVLAALD
jgi:hypothetical protein